MNTAGPNLCLVTNNKYAVAVQWVHKDTINMSVMESLYKHYTLSFYPFRNTLTLVEFVNVLSKTEQPSRQSFFLN